MIRIVLRVRPVGFLRCFAHFRGVPAKLCEGACLKATQIGAWRVDVGKTAVDLKPDVTGIDGHQPDRDLKAMFDAPGQHGYKEGISGQFPVAQLD